MKETLDQVRATVQPLEGPAQLGAQVKQVQRAHVRQCHSLEVLPNAFIRVQFGRIARQLLQCTPPRRLPRQECFDRNALTGCPPWMEAPSQTMSNFPATWPSSCARNRTTSCPHRDRSCIRANNWPAGVTALIAQR